MRKKVNFKIPEDICKLSEAFSIANMQLYVVGGAVRDFLLGKEPHDFDLVTNAQPIESKMIISNLKGFKVSDEQGKHFGVLTIMVKLYKYN